MIQESLAEEWLKAGVQKGDVLLVHSDITRTLFMHYRQKMMISPEDILESFLKAIGPSGTLLLPLFNFDFTKGVPFDIRTSPSKMGALTEAGRMHPLAVRTGHPLYSFCVIGHRAKEFKSVNNFSGYGSDSPFGLLREMDGKIAVLDLTDQRGMTFYHHVEEMHEVDYRYHKTFTGQYTDASGHVENKTYGLFVRKLEDGILTLLNPVGELMWQSGLYSGCRPNEGCGLRTISARNMYDFVSTIILSGKAKNLLYQIEGEHE